MFGDMFAQTRGGVDIMEYYRGLLLANVAWAGSNDREAEWDDSKKPITGFNDRDWSRSTSNPS